MTAYLANHQKKQRIFKKRERELIHALKNGHSDEKIEKAVEKLRTAKLNTFKSNFSANSVLPAEYYEPTNEAKIWESYSVEEIIELYRKHKKT